MQKSRYLINLRRRITCQHQVQPEYLAKDSQPQETAPTNLGSFLSKCSFTHYGCRSPEARIHCHLKRPISRCQEYQVTGCRGEVTRGNKSAEVTRSSTVSCSDVLCPGFN